MMPSPAIESGMVRVEAIAPTTAGNAVQATVRAKISQTWLASHTGAIEWWAWSRMRPRARTAAGEQLPEAGAEVGSGQHGIEGETGQDEQQRDRWRARLPHHRLIRP